MRHILNIKIHPAVILGSVVFWFILYIIIYVCLMIYWINRMFFAHDNSVTHGEFVGTPAVIYINQKIYRSKLKTIVDSIGIGKR